MGSMVGRLRPGPLAWMLVAGRVTLAFVPLAGHRKSSLPEMAAGARSSQFLASVDSPDAWFPRATLHAYESTVLTQRFRRSIV